MADIHKAILDIQSEINHIGKDQRTTGGAIYNFRGIDDVMNAVHPLLAKHRVFVTPTVMQEFREDRVSGNGKAIAFVRLHVKLSLFAEDGSSVDAIVVGEAMDSSDKASAKAHSVAYRIGLLQILCIPTEETAVNVDDDHHEVSPKSGDEELYKKVKRAIATAADSAKLADMLTYYRNSKRMLLDDDQQFTLDGMFQARKIELEQAEAETAKDKSDDMLEDLLEDLP